MSFTTVLSHDKVPVHSQNFRRTNKTTFCSTESSSNWSKFKTMLRLLCFILFFSPFSKLERKSPSCVIVLYVTVFGGTVLL